MKYWHHDRQRSNTGMTKMIITGIIGGAGYVGGELVRLLLRHPQVILKYVQSTSQAGQPLAAVHRDLVGETDMHFTADNSMEVDLLFIALGHGESKVFLKNNPPPAAVKVIDMSQDHRLDDSFIYGLSEINRDHIRTATRIANPGCFATAILLGLAPLAIWELLKNDVHISAITGSTGAGQQLSATTHFSWRDSNISVYKPFTHQHLLEINHLLTGRQNTAVPALHFLPFRGNFTRGILATMYTQTEKSEAEILELYANLYLGGPFVFLTEENPDIKQVTGTNKCLIFLEKHEDQLLIVSVIDNLLKGAAGQAVQNMNIMSGLSESMGLELKANYF